MSDLFICGFFGTVANKEEEAWEKWKELLEMELPDIWQDKIAVRGFGQYDTEAVGVMHTDSIIMNEYQNSACRLQGTLFPGSGEAMRLTNDLFLVRCEMMRWNTELQEFLRSMNLRDDGEDFLTGWYVGASVDT